MEEKKFLDLGVQEYSSILVFSPPEHHIQEIALMDLPKGASVSYVGDGMFDVILIFARNQRDISDGYITAELNDRLEGVSSRCALVTIKKY